jgi:hypothetical protein
MSGIKDKVVKVLDPANIFGKRPGGFNIADAMDPGGAIVKTVTGSDIARKIADPGKLLPKTAETAVTPTLSPTTKLTAAARKTAQVKKEKLARYSNLRARRAVRNNQTILSTDLEDFK